MKRLWIRFLLRLSNLLATMAKNSATIANDYWRLSTIERLSSDYHTATIATITGAGSMVGWPLLAVRFVAGSRSDRRGAAIGR